MVDFPLERTFLTQTNIKKGTAMNLASCRHCTLRFKFPETRSGELVNCPKCKELVQLPIRKLVEQPKPHDFRQIKKPLTPEQVEKRNSTAIKTLLSFLSVVGGLAMFAVSPGFGICFIVAFLVSMLAGFGPALIVAGLITIAGSLLADVTVPVNTYYGTGRVANMQLMQQQVIGVCLGIAAIIVGVLLAALNPKKVKQ